MFITFEGPEGGGKTTQITLLAERFAAERIDYTWTRQPGGEKLGRELRSLMLDQREIVIEPMAELLMMMADRAQSVERIIRPALSQGKVVLCDRYADSSVAYQGYGRGVEITAVQTLNKIATSGLMPQLTFLLDIDAASGLRRQTERNRMEEQEIAFHERVRHGYLEIARAEHERVKVIDATQPVDTVAAEIWSTYEAYRRGRSQ